MNGEPTYIVALGAVTPAGRDVWSSAAAMRAGISAFTEYPGRCDANGEPLKVALAPWLDVALTGFERIQALLMPAIAQVLEVAQTVEPPLRLALALALPAVRPGLDRELAARVVAAVGRHFRHSFIASAAFPHGHAAGLLALDAARRKLATGEIDACVVAGVDSYMEPLTLEWLEDCEQIHGAGALNNAWGFIPGEAAGALLVVGAGHIDHFRASVLAQVVTVATALEARRIKTDTICIGEGLTSAFRAALQALREDERISDVYCDMNGEPYRADEYGFTCLRTKEYFIAASDVVTPATCWGDVCAASAPLHIGLAAAAASKGYARGATALVWASSEGGERAASVLRLRQGATHDG